MYNWCLGFLAFGVFYAHKTNAQTTTQSCGCVTFNRCYQNITVAPTVAPDGTGVIDIRIVNGGGAATVPTAPPTSAPPPATTFPPATITCPAGQEPCCTPNSGCGVRYNIPVTASTTPAAGQAVYGSQPWLADIIGTDQTYIGGGVLYDNLHVITAAHKIINRTEASLIVRLGEWNINTAAEPNQVQNITVSRITRHPNFTPTRLNLFNDVAILRLTTAAVIGPNPAINTACPPGAATVYDGMRCLVSGWGRDAFTGSLQAVLREVDVPIVNSNTCQTQLRTTKLGPNFVLNTTSFMCAGGEANKDACVGDGGSPLVCNVGGKYQVVGLVAWGIGCGTASVPGVYVRLQSFLPWIQANLN